MMKGKSLESSCEFVNISNHQDYLNILNTIRKETEKIIIVQIDGYDKNDSPRLRGNAQLRGVVNYYYLY